MKKQFHSVSGSKAREMALSSGTAAPVLDPVSSRDSNPTVASVLASIHTPVAAQEWTRYVDCRLKQFCTR